MMTTIGHLLYLFTYKPNFFFQKFGLALTKNIPNKGVRLIAINFCVAEIYFTQHYNLQYITHVLLMQKEKHF